MGAGSDLSSITAKPQLPYQREPEPRTIETRSADGYYQGAQVATALETIILTYSGQDASQKGQAEQHFTDNGEAAIKFPWTDPIRATVYNYVYDKESPPVFALDTPKSWGWTVRLMRVK
jgi:phage-related protein